MTLMLTAATLLSGIRTAQAEDGKAILLKAIHLYHTFHSYKGQANVDTLLVGTDGKVVKHVGSSSTMKFQRPNKISLFIQNPAGSRAVYGDGANFSVFEAGTNQYSTVPMSGKEPEMITLLRTQGGVVAGFDALFLLTETGLPKNLSSIQYKGTSTCNGHPVFVVTGTTSATPELSGGGKTSMPGATTMWTWWIDRQSYLLYKVENKTSNVVKPVSFGSGINAVVKDVKGTVIMRYIVSELKPDANLAPSEFAFTPPASALRKRTLQEILGGQKK
ncbi:MAG: putative periplasmic protein [Chthonomonadales bacterium]|nr:putative periplasmic protein [Chthonomonadales bacterium]